MHKAFYRSYRPVKFDEVVGQTHIIQTLKNQIKNENIGHAYLFTGTRGTGKTSTAKIFARAVNCTNSHDQEPCNECDNCRAILDENTIDVVEIDAASNNSVDDVRELRENVKYSPVTCKYKVYIIDEVHMLSQGAFNALLKTLEEPPKYVIFILATTEPHKIPATIMSRCQRFDFKRVKNTDIIQRMKFILSEENIEAEENALRLIASNSGGALRDAISILDQCVSFSNGKILYNDVVEILGTVNIEEMFSLSDFIIKSDTKNALYLLNKFISYGKDIRILVNDLIDHFRNIMVCKVSKEFDEILSLPSEISEKFFEQAQNIETNTLIRILNVLSDVYEKVKSSSNQRVIVEVAIMKLANPIFEDNQEALLDRIKNLEKLVESGKITLYTNSTDENKFSNLQESSNGENTSLNGVQTNKYDNSLDNNSESKAGGLNDNNFENESSSSNEQPKENIEEEKFIKENWQRILKKFKEDKYNNIYGIMGSVKKIKIYSDRMFIIIPDSYSFAAKRLTADETVEYIINTVNLVLNKNYKIKIVFESNFTGVKFQDEEDKEDKGESILKELVGDSILEVKNSEKDNTN
ncbi:MAG: DNA polymerase III subunit gamma/tau [Clostridioides sp.]|jgi:DNA polymerase-3 subunit gamma/tau|nr:DNA polymerase III subunit gamma/tau [Clostridioides sp.]